PRRGARRQSLGRSRSCCARVQRGPDDQSVARGSSRRARCDCRATRRLEQRCRFVSESARRRSDERSGDDRLKTGPGAQEVRGSRWLALSVAATMLAAAGLSLWLRLAARPVTSPRGELLGRLPSGVRVEDLNLLLVTLDTTRADRIHAYGFQ